MVNSDARIAYRRSVITVFLSGSMQLSCRRRTWDVTASSLPRCRSLLDRVADVQHRQMGRVSVRRRRRNRPGGTDRRTRSADDPACCPVAGQPAVMGNQLEGN